MDAWIIDHLKKQERERRQQEEAARPHLRIPAPTVQREEEPHGELKRDWSNWY